MHRLIGEVSPLVCTWSGIFRTVLYTTTTPSQLDTTVPSCPYSTTVLDQSEMVLLIDIGEGHRHLCVEEAAASDFLHFPLLLLLSASDLPGN